MKLSVCLATYNEEENIGRCLKSVKPIADEIIIVDGKSTDKTATIAKEYGAKVGETENLPNFHINKKKALDMAKGEWVILMDADEEISKDLAAEIKKVIEMSAQELETYESSLPHRDLFLRHQELVEQRDGVVGEKTGDYVAFYFPRKNYFLGHFMRYGGVYPDGVIRMFKNGKATLPAKDVHEQMVVQGRVGWLQNDLLHYDSPTFSRYIARNTRYVHLIAKDLEKEKVKKDVPTFINYVIVKPIHWFFLTLLRHKGILDGYQGVVFSFFSALRFTRAYLEYMFKS